jgi:2-haloalkanoic acid dehalogenase type II
MEDVDLITFDCYGTLIDWESGIAAAFQKEALRSGKGLEREEIISVYMAEEPAVESSQYRIYREVLAEVAGRVAARLGWEVAEDRAHFLAESLPGWQPFSDTNPALERLSQRYSLGILSNVDDDLLAMTRRYFKVDFDVIVTAQQVKSYKPGHAHFIEAQRRASGDRILHAAQSYFHDVVPTRGLNMPVVWVNRKGEQAAEGGPLPTYEVPDMAALADLLGV